MEQGGGGFFTRKLGPLPAWVWLAGAAVLVYWYMSKHSQQQNPITTSAGRGSIHTGKTVIQKGAISVHVNAEDQEQPGPHHNRLKSEHGALIVPRDESFAQFAEEFRLNQKQIQDFTTEPQPKGSSFRGKTLKLSTPLKKGQKIYG
jgi:hypothetical protein